MKSHAFEHAGLRFRYRDAGGSGRPLIALHGHCMDGATFEPLTEALTPDWRVVAPDQRGHGDTDHAASYTRADYLGDLDALLSHLGITQPVAVLGHSLGGVNAYQFAARYPGKIGALVIEDIGAENSADMSFVLSWAGHFATRDELAACLGPRFAPYFESSFRETPDGWRLAFDPSDMVASQANLNGDHWPDWLASDCPALLIRGRDSRLTTQAHLEDMATRRPRTRLETLDGGHVVHADSPAEFAALVRSFLDEV